MSVVLQNGPQVRLRVVAALPGERGIPGPPATILGTLPSVDDLPPTGERGDIYTIDGDGWAWDGMQWVNAGRFQGEQGEQGIQGEVGPPPVLASGTVSTLAPGSAATASVVPLPSPGEYQIDFGIPEGMQGIQGIQGIQGEVGPAPVMLAGAVTTLAPGSSATSAVTPTANPGEYALTLGIPQGAKGDKGDSFDVDAVGPFSDRSLYDGEPAGFSFLDTDASLLYIRLGASGWSDAIPFGKGDPGPQGETGPAGPGIAVGGTVGQSLIKAGAGDYDTAWATLTKGDVGLGNVDNTSDADKPVSLAQQAALNLKAPLASPALTGVPTAPTAAVATNTTQIATTAFLRNELNASPMAGFRNKIINGDFMVLQLGEGPFTATGYTYDMWPATISGGTCSITRQAVSGVRPAQVPLKAACAQFVFTGGSGASDFTTYAQTLENVDTLAGKKATLTFYAKMAVSGPIYVELEQRFGTGGTPSGRVIVPGSKVTIGTAWARYDVVFDVPSVAGKILGANNDDFAIVRFYMSAGSTYDVQTDNLGVRSGTFSLTRVSIVEGDARSETDPFEPRNPSQEIALCKRYYEVSAARVEWTNPGNSGSVPQRLTYPFTVEKRAVPTMSIVTTEGNTALMSATKTEFVVYADNAGMTINKFFYGAAARF